jgi:hypothetical protein
MRLLGKNKIKQYFKLNFLFSIKQPYYYDNGINASCAKCHYSCSSCSGPNQNQCLSCGADTNRNLNNNLCVCNLGYFDNNTSICGQCDQQCAECMKKKKLSIYLYS